MSGTTAQDSTWANKERGDEANYIRQREQEQIAALAAKASEASSEEAKQERRDEIEGGFGGQEDLEDRYATTSGEH